MGTLRRRALLGLLGLSLVALLAWSLWPSTAWPAAFCLPISRVVGHDADALVQSPFDVPLAQTPARPVTSHERHLVTHLVHDARSADHTAPTSRLRGELDHYVLRLSGVTTSNQVEAAMGHFGAVVHDQLRRCDIYASGDRNAAP